MGATADYYIGLMSGTSLDGVDGVLVDFSGSKCQVAQYCSASIAPDLRAELLALNLSGADELHRAALAANAIATLYSEVVLALLAQSKTHSESVCAIGAHGQTVRHRPQEFGSCGYTIQLNNPALLAERTGITVVADFRSRDVAAGGQGAPLVPAFHQFLFGEQGQSRAILNIGGMANLSLLAANGDVVGFDCGPGNVLMDLWCHRHTGRAYDENGDWASSGIVHDMLLRSLRAEPFFALPPPKSTGRDLFDGRWLDQRLTAFTNVRPQDVQATLLELTATTCIAGLGDSHLDLSVMAVCGGGALNTRLMARLLALLPATTQLTTTDAWGLPAQQVEATAFAWLARQTIQGLPGNLPKATGAAGARILGAVYPK